MHRCLLVFSLLLLTPALCLDLTVTYGADDDDYEGFRSNYIIRANWLEEMRFQAETNPLGDQFDFLYNLAGYYTGLHDYYLNTASFAPWPAPHTTLFAPPYSYVGVFNIGFYPYYYDFFTGRNFPAEYLGIAFDLPVTELFAVFETTNFYPTNIISEQYYYHTAINNVFNWPFESNPFEAYSLDGFNNIFPFHVTAKTVNGYYYYDWLIGREVTDYDNYRNVDFDDDYDVDFLSREFVVLASDPRGIDWLKVYSMIPENNRYDIYQGYNWENYQVPQYYNWLYLNELAARIATPSTTRTITATVTPSPNFLRHPSHSATESPTITHTAGTVTPSSSHSPIYKSGSNTPSRTPNQSATRTPTSSTSSAPVPSTAPSASAAGQTATSSPPVSPSATSSPVTPTNSPTVTSTATGTRTAFLTASNTQAPGRNVPSASIAPSVSSAVPTFTQPSSSTAVLVQFNVLCLGYCSGTSASQLQLEIAKYLNLNEEFIRIVAIHEFFEGDSEITILICSNENVDTMLNAIQAGTFTQEYFNAISVESVDWTVRCDMDLYNYLALSSQYIDTGSSGSSLVPLFVLFFLQLWMLA